MDLDRTFQKSGRAKNGFLNFGPLATTSTLISAYSAAHTLYVQRIVVWINTSVAQSISFQDSAASPLIIAVIPASPGASTRWDFYFGPKGVPLTKGANLTATFSGSGNAGHMEWNAYMIPQTTLTVPAGSIA